MNITFIIITGIVAAFTLTAITAVAAVNLARGTQPWRLTRRGQIVANTFAGATLIVPAAGLLSMI